jgi:antitoxin YefM
MNAITMQEAERDLGRIITQVVDDAEPTIVIGNDGRQVVVMPLDDYNAWQETRYLLSSPANAAHLLRSIAQADATNAGPA